MGDPFSLFAPFFLTGVSPSREGACAFRRSCYQNRQNDIVVHSMKRLPVVVSLAMSLPFIGASQGTLIGPSTLNGSFESGFASPWSGIVVARDPAFASQGDWFAVLQSATAPTARDICFQFLSANPSSGLTFITTFDARNGSAGFESVNAFFFARNTDGTFVNATAIPITSPPLGSSGWGNYQTDFQLPGTWDGVGSISLQIQFTKHGAVSGTTYFGYLDNITLQQIPEPSIPALVGLAALLATCRLFLRQRWPNNHLA